MRNDGYYWINVPGSGWIVGEFSENKLFITSCETTLPDRFIEEIDENQIIRK